MWRWYLSSPETFPSCVLVCKQTAKPDAKYINNMKETKTKYHVQEMLESYASQQQWIGSNRTTWCLIRSNAKTDKFHAFSNKFVCKLFYFCYESLTKSITFLQMHFGFYGFFWKCAVFVQAKYKMQYIFAMHWHRMIEHNKIENEEPSTEKKICVR